MEGAGGAKTTKRSAHPITPHTVKRNLLEQGDREREKNQTLYLWGKEKEFVLQVEAGEGHWEVPFPETEATMAAQYIRWTCCYIYYNNESR